LGKYIKKSVESEEWRVGSGDFDGDNYKERVESGIRLST
jgi:hypothetical protein